MKYSLSWLKDLAGFNWPIELLSEKLAELGFPVESIHQTGVSIPNVVSAKILSVEKHPNADRLSVTQVDDGTGGRIVVCGATNIAAGQVVPLARPGAVLPNGITIAQAKIRGVESSGMLCSERELGMSEAHEGIFQLPKDAPLGQTLDKIFGSDTVIELEIPPNRPDVLSHVGLARELSAAAGKPLKLAKTSWKAAPTGPTCPIQISDKKGCSLYLGKVLQNLKVGPSPRWMSQRLEACGIRPINNVVDITNYVLLEWGHPLHAFDLALLKGPKVDVRRATKGEKMEALDAKVYELSEDDLVIADAQGPVAIAGIMGGQGTGVTPTTTDILLESAVFDRVSVRRTSRRLVLSSESSIRFEKGTDVETAALASARAASLIMELAQAKPGRESVARGSAIKSKSVSLDLGRMNRMIGSTYKKEVVQSVLKKLNYGVAASKDGWTLKVPSYRSDIAEEADVVEDVLRFVGYNTIPSAMMSHRAGTGVTEDERYQFFGSLREVLKGWGLNETSTSTLLSIESTRPFGFDASRLALLANPLSKEESALRPLILINLLRAAELNIRNRRERIALFEIGARHSGDNSEDHALAVVLSGSSKGTHWREKAKAFDFYHLKGLIEELGRVERVNLSLDYGSALSVLHPQQQFRIVINGSEAGWGGVLHPSLVESFSLPETTVVFEVKLPFGHAKARSFKAFSRQPSVERDLAIVVEQSVAWSTIEGVVRQAGGALLKSVMPFDVFTGGSLEASKKSVAFRCILQHEEKTLSEADISGVVQKITSGLNQHCGAQLR